MKFNPKAPMQETWRKFSIAILAYVGNFIALALGWIDGQVYEGVTVGVIGLYMAGNVGEYAVRSRHQRLPAPRYGPYPDDEYIPRHAGEEA